MLVDILQRAELRMMNATLMIEYISVDFSTPSYQLVIVLFRTILFLFVTLDPVVFRVRKGEFPISVDKICDGEKGKRGGVV